MVVNALVTGLIVFKILMVLLEVKATYVEQNLGSLSSTGGPKLQHIIFIIIESGMALFAIQLIRIVISNLNQIQTGPPTPFNLTVAFNLVVSIHQMLNVIIKSVHFLLFLFY